MKTLIITPKGKMIVKTTELQPVATPTMSDEIEERSPIVSKTNQPKGLPPLKDKPEAKAKLPESAYKFTKATLLAEMEKAGGHKLQTNIFAEMIAPHVKKSVDPVQHDVWDFALSYIRKLMRQLVKDGLVKEEIETSSYRVFYLYSIIQKKKK